MKAVRSYSLIVIGLPRDLAGSAPALSFSRPAQRSLTLRPAYSPSHIMTLYTGGFSRFIASTTAPIATGWSESCRAGFAPAGKPCLATAHTIKGRYPTSIEQFSGGKPQYAHFIEALTRLSAKLRQVVVEVFVHENRPLIWLERPKERMRVS